MTGLQGELPQDPSGRPAWEDDPRGELEVISSHLDSATPQRVVAWAVGWYGEGIVLASSFQDCVLIDIAVGVDPTIKVVFLDTGFHFPETLEYVEAVRSRYDLNLEVVHPGVGPDRSPCGSPSCCELRKVAPLHRVLEDKQAWMTGIRRDETPSRAGAQVVEWDARAGRVKVNPLAGWAQEDADRYASERGLPTHPLVERGFASIGCAPTTRAVTDGEHPRAGRWPDEEKTECGLHV